MDRKAQAYTCLLRSRPHWSGGSYSRTKCAFRLPCCAFLCWLIVDCLLTKAFLCPQGEGIRHDPGTGVSRWVKRTFALAAETSRLFPSTYRVGLLQHPGPALPDAITGEQTQAAARRPTGRRTLPEAFVAPSGRRRGRPKVGKGHPPR